MALGDEGGGSRLEFPDLSRYGRQLGGGVRLIVIGVLLLALAGSSVYSIQPEEVGVIMRFGRYVRSESPGLQVRLPFGIERLQRVQIQRQLKAEFGFRTLQSGIRSETTARGYGDESAMLTGDLNAAIVEWVVQYHIVDPESYLFRVRNVERTFRDMSEAVMRRVVGDRTVNEVITIGRQEIEDQAKVELQELCDTYQTGIRVDQIVLQDVNPPDPVKPSFNEVNQAEQEREQLINEAQSSYNQQVPRAEGEAQRTVQEAEGYALDRVNRAQGDAARFTSLYDAYRKAPDVTRRRIYLETMAQVLPKAGRKVVVGADLEGILPMLDLSSATPLARAGQAAGRKEDQE